MSNWFPAINTGLLLILMALVAWRFRMDDMSRLWDEIRAIQFRLGVQEKVSPCPHCRDYHLSVHGDDHDDC